MVGIHLVANYFTGSAIAWFQYGMLVKLSASIEITLSSSTFFEEHKTTIPSNIYVMLLHVLGLKCSLTYNVNSKTISIYLMVRHQ